ncbi:MAG: DNA polymerase III subunit delta [Phycisphaerales bacterium]
MAKRTTKTPTPPADEAVVRVALLHGPERFVQHEFTQQLRDALVKTHGEVDVLTFDGESASLADVLDECRSIGLMQQHKLVIVDHADRLLKADDDAEPGAKPAKGRGTRGARPPREIMQQYVEAPAEQATLVLRADRWHPGNLDKAIAKVGLVKKCEAPRREDAVAWAIERCKAAHGGAIDPAAADLLVEHIGCELGRLDSELAKLVMVNPGAPISLDVVREMVGVTREEEIWTSQSKLMTGDPADGLNRLRDLIEISREDPVPIMFSYIDLARKLHSLSRCIKQGENPHALAGGMRLWGPAKDAMIVAAKRYPPAAFARLLADAVAADSRQKSSSTDAVRALEVLTLRFASVFAAARR